MNEIKVSIIMPVYNSGEYLKTAVDSILNQCFQEIELILVDDGSTDGSSERCDKYAEKDNRIVVIHQKNGGICNARNTALKIAKGEYIAFSDHDDEFLPGLLEGVYNVAKKDNADMVKFCKKELIISNEGVIRILETKLQNRSLRGSREIGDNYFELLNKKALDCVWDSLIRRKNIINNKIFFDEQYKAGGEDIDFITRLLEHVNVLSLMEDCYYVHYIRIGFSTSAKYNPIKLESVRLLAQKITRGAESLGINLLAHKQRYLYQMTFTLLNGTVSLLSNRNCLMTRKEKYKQLSLIRDEPYLPNWFWSQSASLIVPISKRYAMSYFLFKHRIFWGLFAMTQLRTLHLNLKTRLISIKTLR